MSSNSIWKLVDWNVVSSSVKSGGLRSTKLRKFNKQYWESGCGNMGRKGTICGDRLWAQKYGELWGERVLVSVCRPHWSSSQKV